MPIFDNDDDDDDDDNDNGASTESLNKIDNDLIEGGKKLAAAAAAISYNPNALPTNFEDLAKDDEEKEDTHDSLGSYLSFITGEERYGKKLSMSGE